MQVFGFNWGKSCAGRRWSYIPACLRHAGYSFGVRDNVTPCVGTNRLAKRRLTSQCPWRPLCEFSDAELLASELQHVKETMLRRFLVCVASSSTCYRSSSSFDFLARRQKNTEGEKNVSRMGPPTALPFLSARSGDSQTQRRNIPRRRFLQLEGNRILVRVRWMPFETNKEQIIKDESENCERALESNSGKITRRRRMRRWDGAGWKLPVIRQLLAKVLRPQFWRRGKREDLIGCSDIHPLLDKVPPSSQPNDAGSQRYLKHTAYSPDYKAHLNIRRAILKNAETFFL